jgi:hypothetical protein
MNDRSLNRARLYRLLETANRASPNLFEHLVKLLKAIWR